MIAYEQAMPTTNRRGFLKLAILTVGGAIVIRALAVPGLGDVVTGDHAVQKHDLGALAVRRFYAAQGNATIFGQPPCRDGRYRIVQRMPTGEYAVWVLMRLRASLWQEITAFTTRNQDYIKALRDDCGNGGWFGHGLYAGGANGQKGAGIGA